MHYDILEHTCLKTVQLNQRRPEDTFQYDWLNRMSNNISAFSDFINGYSVEITFSISMRINYHHQPQLEQFINNDYTNYRGIDVNGS